MSPRAAERLRTVPAVLPARSEATLFLAALSLAAAMIHAVVAVPHVEESIVEAVLFALLAIAQTGWGAAVYASPSSTLLAGGALLNASVIAVWIASRTAGIPGAEREPIGLADLGATAAELGICIGCVLALLRRTTGRELRPWLRQAALVILIFAGVALVGGSSHHHV
jgi:hypothetical protein